MSVHARKSPSGGRVIGHHVMHCPAQTSMFVEFRAFGVIYTAGGLLFGVWCQWLGPVYTFLRGSDICSTVLGPMTAELFTTSASQGGRKACASLVVPR